MPEPSVAILGVVKEIVDIDTVTLVWHGTIIKGRILASTGVVPAVGNAVIAEYLQGSREYYIVAIT